jgi:putative hemolysin
MPACRFCNNTGRELIHEAEEIAENVYQYCRCKYGRRLKTEFEKENELFRSEHPQ